MFLISASILLNTTVKLVVHLLQELAALSLNAYVHIWDATTFTQASVIIKYLNIPNEEQLSLL